MPTLARRVELFMRLYDEIREEPYGKDTQIAISFKGGGPGGGSVDVNTQRQEFRAYMVLFRQFIGPRENVYLGRLLRDLPPYLRDPEFRRRLACARRDWIRAHCLQSPIAPLVLGRLAEPRKMTKVYLYGGIFHSDDRRSAQWDSLSPGLQATIEWAFRQYEGRVRGVVVEVRKVIVGGRDAGSLAIPGLAVDIRGRPE